MTALKALTENRVGGYLVSWGSKEQCDLQGEYFTPATELGLEWYDKRPALYHHGLDGKIKSTVIGVIDKLELDEKGLWAEAQINMHNEYANAIMTLVGKGALGWSSGSLPHLVQIDAGFIKSWPIVEGSLTPTPAEPRNTSIQPLKHYAIDALLEGLVAKGADGTSGNGKKQIETQTTNQKEKTMNAYKMLSDEMKAEIVALITDELAKLKPAIEADLGEEIPIDEITAAIAEGAVAVIEDTMPDQDKADADIPVDKELEKKKSVLWVEANIDKIINSAIERYEKGNVASAKAILKRGSRIANAVKNNTPAVSQKGAVGGYREGGGRITVEEERAYVHLSAAEMAIGAKIAAAARYPHGVPHNIKMGALGLSDGYIKSMAHKIASEMQVSDKTRVVKAWDGIAQADRYAVKSAMGGMKADELDSVSITNQGAEWAFVWYDANLWELGRAETRLFDMMSARGMKTVDVTGKLMNVKLNTTSPTAYTVGEARSVGASGNPENVVQITPWGTDQVEKSVQYHVLATSYTDQLSEQSVIDIVQFVNNDATTVMAETLEDAFINGDTTTTSANINTDGTPGTGMQKPLYLAWDGIRHNYLIDNTGQRRDGGGGLTVDDYINTLSLFDVAIQPRHDRMLFIIDPYVETATRKLASLQTVDVAGEARATIFHGSLPPLFGVEVYTSGFARKSQADGTISATAANNTVGTISAVYAPYWQYGRQRAIQVELQRNALGMSTTVVVSMGHVLAARGANAACGTRNVGV